VQGRSGSYWGLEPVFSFLFFFFLGACFSYLGYIGGYGVLWPQYRLGYIRLWQRACMYGHLEGIEQVSVLALVCDIGGIIATLHLCDTVRFSLLFLIHNSIGTEHIGFSFRCESRIMVLSIAMVCVLLHRDSHRVPGSREVHRMSTGTQGSNLGNP
jgi:hypothetical protein